MFFLPEAHTDFIFALIGEELGLIGALGVLGAVRAARGARLPRRRSPSRSLRASARLRPHVAASSSRRCVNIGVVVGLLPTKGLPLPFLSYGGSALVVT